MKASELRIDNWFKTFEVDKSYGDEYFQVETLRKNKGGEIGVGFRKGSCWSVVELLKPIPLNKEWLLKFGFMSYNLLDEDRTPILTIDCGEHVIDFIVGYYDECEVDDLKTPCKYVHQLQNLYFALTGEELTIK